MSDELEAAACLNAFTNKTTRGIVGSMELVRDPHCDVSECALRSSRGACVSRAVWLH